MSCISLPEKIYFKQGCLPVALDELGTVMGKEKVFIITDKKLYDSGTVKPVEQKLNELGIQHFTYFDISETLTLDVLKKCAKAVNLFEPDVIIAAGGKNVLESGKLVRVMYEYPQENMIVLAEKFPDINTKDIFPRTNKKVYLVTIPTGDCDSAEVTPCAEFTDGDRNYTIADYELTAEMAIIDRTDNLTSFKFAFQEMFE